MKQRKRTATDFYIHLKKNESTYHTGYSQGVLFTLAVLIVLYFFYIPDQFDYFMMGFMFVLVDILFYIIFRPREWMMKNKPLTLNETIHLIKNVKLFVKECDLSDDENEKWK